MMTLIGDPLYRPYKNEDVTRKGAVGGALAPESPVPAIAAPPAEAAVPAAP